MLQHIAIFGAKIWHCPICTCSVYVFVSVLSLLSLLLHYFKLPLSITIKSCTSSLQGQSTYFRKKNSLVIWIARPTNSTNLQLRLNSHKLRAPPVSQRFCSAKSVTCQTVRYPQCVHRFSRARRSADGLLFCLRGSSSAHPWSLKRQLLACVRSYRIFYSARFDCSATCDFHSDIQTSMVTMLTVRRNRTTVRFERTLVVAYSSAQVYTIEW